jgi:hypothetical protein
MTQKRLKFNCEIEFDLTLLLAAASGGPLFFLKEKRKKVH